MNTGILCQPTIEYNKLSVEDILKLPEEKINVGMTTLILAKEYYPNLNVEFFLKTFDYLADRYKYYFGKYSKPDDRIRALNTYLFKPGFWNDSITFYYDNDDLNAKKLDNRFINGYIAGKKGSCITMPMLYVILGERLGFPIYPVRSPMHFFVRYVEKDKSQNIEATNGGGLFLDEEYKNDFMIPDKAIKNGVYLRTLTKKEYIASLLLINANEYIARDNKDKAKHYLQLAIKYDSTFSPAYWNYGLVARDEAKQIEKEILQNSNNELCDKYLLTISSKLEEYKKFTGKAEKLGIVHKFTESFFEKQKESITKFKQKGGY
jgi:regulator of sirC expression with transglutaminase-like and TPR domain